MDINKEQKCRICDGSFTLKGILDRAEHYWPELDLLICKSPCCNKPEEIQIKDGQIVRGYVYAAGSPHFADMEHYTAPGLTVSKSMDSITYELHGAKITIRAKS